ncbi:MAG: Smr/MutS family protein [Candidatus Pelagibacter sp.]
MIKKISEKDIKDWEEFVKKGEKLEDKDNFYEKVIEKKYRKIDLHGYTLEGANKKMHEYINECFENNVLIINVITGKGSRSKNKENPYSSSELGILKNSVPNYIKNNKKLMKKIKFIDFDEENKINKGSFNIFLKKK